jgi:hypothetical protein
MEYRGRIKREVHIHKFAVRSKLIMRKYPVFVSVAKVTYSYDNEGPVTRWLKRRTDRRDGYSTEDEAYELYKMILNDMVMQGAGTRWA